MENNTGPINSGTMDRHYLDDEEDETNTSSFPDSSANSDNPKNMCTDVFKNITVEPMMLGHMIGMACSMVVVQNMYLDRICRITFGHSEDICKNLTESAYEKQVEGTAAKYTTYRGLIEAGFPILFSLFLGPWTDVHGTKYPILLPILGYGLSSCIYLIMTFFPDLPPAFILFASIPVALSGGMVALIMSVFSFIGKITTTENRSFRVAMLEASWFLGGPIGLVTGGYIYKYGDFQQVFMMSGTLYVLAFIYGIIRIKNDGHGVTGEPRSCCADMFNVEAVKDIIATVTRDRGNKCRRWMIIMLIAICLRIFVMMGYINTMYLYTRNKFKWTLENYTEYSVADSFIAITGSYIMVMLTMKIFKINDAVIGIIGSASSVLGTIVFFSASEGWMVYVGCVISMFAGLPSIVIRSMLSKIVAKEEIAKVYTFLACGEASMPLIATPLYNLVFMKTNTVFPGAIFLISLGAYGIVLGSFIYLYISMKNYNPDPDGQTLISESNA